MPRHGTPCAPTPDPRERVEPDAHREPVSTRRPPTADAECLGGVIHARGVAWIGARDHAGAGADAGATASQGLIGYLHGPRVIEGLRRDRARDAPLPVKRSGVQR
jgi:hypothetical protein